MRRIGRYRRKKQRNIFIIGSLSLLLFLCVGYAAFSTNLSITAKGNIKQQTRVIQSWNDASQTDFHSDFYKQNIIIVTFLDNNNVPDNATESWNVSEDKENGKVMAWVIPNNDNNTKYDLYIGAKGGVIANENSSFLFYNFRDVKEINFNNNFDISNTIDMSKMFHNCSSLINLDLSNFDTRNVTSMYAMFCMWDNNNFLQNNLNFIIFGKNFITSNVINMKSMFAGLIELKNLDLSNFDTSNVTNMFHMFLHCHSLTELDLNSFDTSNVTNMENMFGACENLTVLNICSFNTKKVTNMKWMFQYNGKLSAVYVGPNWSTNQANTSEMFLKSKVSSVTTGQC